MTLSTFVTELATMHVIGAMAAGTIRSQRDRRGIGNRLPVTTVAIDTLVSAIERESGLGIVIELPREPLYRRVALRAVGAEFVLVHIVREMAIDTDLRCIEERVSLVAIVAPDFPVRAEQGKCNQVMIEAHVICPRDLQMTSAALVAELILVRIVLFVTPDTKFRRQRIGNRFDMAGNAFDFFVRSIQHEFSIRIMIESDVEPISFPMAICALRAVYAVMRIVFQMAADTFRRYLDFELVAFVAGLADETRVAVNQRERCRCKMIESRLFPVHGRMTALTVIAVLPHVRIVLTVTAHTGRRRIDVVLANMATDATQRLMRAGQGVTTRSLVVVESVSPFGFSMTVAAGLSKVAEVLIVLDMTGCALGLGVMKAIVRQMAIDTLGFEMTVAQREPGHRVIECDFVQAQHVCISAFMICMANRTFLIADLWRLGMKTAVCRKIGRDFLVTVETENSLGFA